MGLGMGTPLCHQAGRAGLSADLGMMGPWAGPAPLGRVRPLLLCQHKGRPGCCREVSTVKLYGGENLTFLSFNLFLDVINIYEEPVSHL